MVGHFQVSYSCNKDFRMIIILDTNIFVRDYRLNGKDFRLFFDGIAKVQSNLCLPTIVLEEVENKFKEELASQIEQTNKPIRKLSRLLNRDVLLNVQNHQLQKEAIAYREYLLETLTDVDVTLLPYPVVSHEEIVRRALDRKRPFDSRGSVGYRDFLIWCNVLEALAQYQAPVIFITQNTSDFMEADGPHQDLLVDLEQRGIPSDRLIFCNSLDSFNSKFIVPALAKIDTLRLRIQNGTSASFDIRDWLSRNIIDLVGEDVIKYAGAAIPEECGSASAQVKSIKSIEINDLRQMVSGDIYIQVEATLNIDINLTIRWEDYVNFEEAKDLCGEVDEPFSYSWVDLEEEFRVSFSMFLESDLKRVLDAELEIVSTSSTFISFDTAVT